MCSILSPLVYSVIKLQKFPSLLHYQFPLSSIIPVLPINTHNFSRHLLLTHIFQPPISLLSYRAKLLELSTLAFFLSCLHSSPISLLNPCQLKLLPSLHQNRSHQGHWWPSYDQIQRFCAWNSVLPGSLAILLSWLFSSPTGLSCLLCRLWVP